MKRKAVKRPENPERKSAGASALPGPAVCSHSSYPASAFFYFAKMILGIAKSCRLGRGVEIKISANTKENVFFWI